MSKKFAISIILTLLSLNELSCQDDFLYDTFPDNFSWGFATAAYQIEGGWNASRKGESIWDEFTHRNLSTVVGKATGDIACDSYNKYEEDVQLLKDLGADFYRFSIAWTRIFPDGTNASRNAAGIDYYNRLIDSLIENGIKPMVTMYHWDLPQALEEQGGWPNFFSDIDQHFENYARTLFEEYGDRVKQWITFNEPYNTCELGYGLTVAAPGRLGEFSGLPYICAHMILKSHARAYRVYENEFKESQKGEVGIVIDTEWMEPKDPNSPDDQAAAERARLFKHGWFAFPVFFGDYPEIMRTSVGGRLPSFTEEEKKQLNGSWDFLGLNHYTTELCTPGPCNLTSWNCDQKVRKSKDPTWEGAASAWLKKVPWGLRKLLNWIKVTYGNPKVYITENGWSDAANDGLVDSKRTSFYMDYINNVLKAVKLDGCNVQAYTAWSLLDNFEWINGYTDRFGVYWINFTDDARPRIPKESTKTLKQIFADNGFPPGSSGSQKILPCIFYLIISFLLYVKFMI